MMNRNSTRKAMMTRNITRKGSRTRIAQINLNHTQAAQDLMTQWTLEREIEICAVQEPWMVFNTDYWYKSKNGLAAIYWNRGVSNIPCRLVMEGQHTVAVKYRSFTLISCYSSPNSTQVEYEEMLDEIKSTIMRENRNTIVCGDFNAKSPMWSSKRTNNRGRCLIDLANTLDLRLLNEGAAYTCVRSQGSSIIDTTWTTPDIQPRICDWKVEEDEISLSDHRYITFTVNEGDAMRIVVNRRRVAWIYSKFDCDKFHAVFTWECTQEDVMEKYGLLPVEISEKVDGIMKRACDAAMPRQSQCFRKRVSNYWWSEEIDQKRKECIRLRRKWKRLRRKPDSEIEREEEYREVKKELRGMIAKAKSTAWKALIKTIDEDPWGLPYRIVMSKLRRNTPTLSEMLDKDVLEDTLGQLFPNALKRKGIQTEMDMDWNEDWDIRAHEIHRIARKRTVSNTAPGIDGVKSLFWKQISDEMVEFVAEGLTICLRNSTFPKQWKIAQLVLIPKSDFNPEKPKVRPICLLPEIGKIFERILAERMLDWMDKNEEAALSPNQFGFRKLRSTTDAIVELREFVEFAHKQGGVVIAVGLDISNAFNSLQWADICDVLKSRKFPIYLQRVIYNYLENRNIIYTNMDGEQMTRNMDTGVPQGSVLGPLLWNITFDQVLRGTMEKGCRLLAYADDTLILATGESVERARQRVNFQIARTIKKIKDLKLEVAAKKTEVVVFTPDKRVPPIVKVTIDKEMITSKRSMKYLGVMIDDKFTFQEHMDYINSKVTKIMKSLWKLMPNLHGPNERKRKLYANVLSSVVLYAAPVWAHKAMKKGKVQNSLKAMHRGIVLRVIAAYRTVAYDAAALLSRIPPYHLTAEARKSAYERIRETKIKKCWSKKSEREIISEENLTMMEKWKTYLRDKSNAGVRTRDAILPVWDEWMARRHGNLSFHLTQMLTGHGVFYTYLRRIGKANTDICPHCDENLQDSMEHTLVRCKAWNEERRELIDKLKITTNILTLKSMVSEMVKSKEGWSAAHTFAERVMYEKEEQERRFEAQAQTQSDDDPDDDD